LILFQTEVGLLSAQIEATPEYAHDQRAAVAARPWSSSPSAPPLSSPLSLLSSTERLAKKKKVGSDDLSTPSSGYAVHHRAWSQAELTILASAAAGKTGFEPATYCFRILFLFLSQF
jgi:hypothetical protein